MALQIKCPGCLKVYKIKEEYLGKKVKCGCGKMMVIPHPKHSPSSSGAKPAASPAPSSNVTASPATQPQPSPPTDDPFGLGADLPMQQDPFGDLLSDASLNADPDPAEAAPPLPSGNSKKQRKKVRSSEDGESDPSFLRGMLILIVGIILIPAGALVAYLIWNSGAERIPIKLFAIPLFMILGGFSAIAAGFKQIMGSMRS